MQTDVGRAILHLLCFVFHCESQSKCFREGNKEAAATEGEQDHKLSHRGPCPGEDPAVNPGPMARKGPVRRIQELTRLTGGARASSVAPVHLCLQPLCLFIFPPKLSHFPQQLLCDFTHAVLQQACEGTQGLTFNSSQDTRHCSLAQPCINQGHPRTWSLGHRTTFIFHLHLPEMRTTRIGMRSNFYWSYQSYTLPHPRGS